MLAISVRVRPCSARCSARSVGRLTSSWPSSCVTSITRALRSSRLPRGPATRTTSGSIVTVTESGTGMGFLPMRDMARLPDLGDDLAADARLARVVAGHHAVGRGQDRGPHAAQHLRNVLGVDVGALAGPRDAPNPRDHRRAALGVLEPDDNPLAGGTGTALDGLERLDVALLAQDPGELLLELRRRDLDRLVGGHDPVAYPRQKVSDGICHGHRSEPSTRACECLLMSLPARLGHAGDVALVRELAQADAAEAELLVDRARPAALAAARIRARLVLRRPRGADDLGGLGHVVGSLLFLRPRRPGRSRTRSRRGARRERRACPRRPAARTPRRRSARWS